MKALVTDKKLQMLISTALILLTQLDNSDDESTEDAKNMIKVLEKGKRGRPDAMKLLIKFLETSENPLVVNRKAPALTTLTEWIDHCIKIGRDELERQKGDAAAGRNSAKDDSPADATAWAYLLKAYDESKTEGTKVTRCNRYTCVPDHLKDS